MVTDGVNARSAFPVRTSIKGAENSVEEKVKVAVVRVVTALGLKVIV